MSDRCAKCGHARVFHQVGTGNGVPVGRAYCDDRHSDPCSCTGFVEHELPTLAGPANSIFYPPITQPQVGAGFAGYKMFRSPPKVPIVPERLPAPMPTLTRGMPPSREMREQAVADVLYHADNRLDFGVLASRIVDAIWDMDAYCATRLAFRPPTPDELDWERGDDYRVAYGKWNQRDPGDEA